MMIEPMDPADAMEVLAVASAFDERKPSNVQAIVWAEELTQLRISKVEACEAVRRFYRAEPDKRVKPGHLPAYVAELRRERLQQARAQEIADRRRYMLETGKAAHRFEDKGNGFCRHCGQTDSEGRKHIRARTNATERLIAEVRRTLPPGDPGFIAQLDGGMREPRPLPGQEVA